MTPITSSEDIFKYFTVYIYFEMTNNTNSIIFEFYCYKFIFIILFFMKTCIKLHRCFIKFRFLLAATATFAPFQAGPSVLTNENQGAATACLEKAVLQERLHEIPGSL